MSVCLRAPATCPLIRCLPLLQPPRRTGRLFYRDSPFRCRDCGTESVWSAEEQRFWFERADGPRQSVAVSCTSCRRKLKERDTSKSSRAA